MLLRWFAPISVHSTSRLPAVCSLRSGMTLRGRTQLRRRGDAINEGLDEGLPRASSTDLYKQKCSAVFEHFYESYPERNANVYTSVL
jgi:type I restriction enzyme, R subunit